MSLVFDMATAASDADPQRADVACFVGTIARRADYPLPADVRAQITRAGWLEGIWRRPEAQVEALLDIPAVLDSWEQFDRLFAWDARALRAEGDARCASYLGAAVRSYFARGGRCAVIVRTGDPWPLLESLPQRLAARSERLRRLLPADFSATDPSSWHGIQHLAGLRDTSLLLLPDLADICSRPAVGPRDDPPLPAVATGFVECSEADAPLTDNTLRRLWAPRLDNEGFATWRSTLQSVRAFLARHQREAMLLTSLPLPHDEARRTIGNGELHAQSNMLDYLQELSIVGAQPLATSDDPGPASAFVQLAWPWLRTEQASDLPEALEAPEGVLAGLVSCGAIANGTFRSVAGDFSLARLRDVTGAEPVPSWGLGDDSPDAQLARRVCLFAQQPDGWALQSDVTLSSNEAWRFGGASRLMGSILRSARANGDAMAFEANGEAAWRDVRRAMENLLSDYWRAGAFAGARMGEAFEVRCDRSTMTQSDLDAGRMVVEITVRPAMSIERITVRLGLATAGSVTSLREAA